MLKQVWESIGNAVGTLFFRAGRTLRAMAAALVRARVLLVLAGALGLAGYAAWRHPPVQTLGHGEVGIRSNALVGGTKEFGEGPVLVIPGLQTLRRYSLRDRTFRSEASSRADGPAPFQSVEGLSLGVDLGVRYALDPHQLGSVVAGLPENIDTDVVEPAVQGVVYRIFSKYTVREIFSTRRAEIQKAIESELTPILAADAILLRGVQVGRVDLPSDYRAGMDKLLAEELETESMKYTLTLKEQQVKQSGLEADADKVRREKSAEAAGNEQIIAAKAQAEAMQHVLPFKQKQIEQRRLEAEADKMTRVSNAQANAQARVIEATGEAESRHKLADVEAYRLEEIGKVTSAQMERDGELLTRHPLLIQKTMADKLSDKVSVIIAPPSAGGFIGASLLGQKSGAPMSSNEENP